MARHLKRVLALCYRRGFFLRRDSEVDGIRQYDYGPVGAALKRNLISEWLVPMIMLNITTAQYGMFVPILAGGKQL